MSEARELDFEPTILRLLQSEEKLQMAARARDAILAVTDRRLVVADDQRVALDIPYDSVRRVQFDIERARPDRDDDIAVPPEEYDRAASALAVIGQRLSEH